MKFHFHNAAYRLFGVASRVAAKVTGYSRLWLWLLNQRQYHNVCCMVIATRPGPGAAEFQHAFKVGEGFQRHEQEDMNRLLNEQKPAIVFRLGTPSE